MPARDTSNRRRLSAVAIVVIVLALVSVGAYVVAARHPRTAEVSAVDAIVAGYDEREDRYIDALLATPSGSSSWAGLDASKAIALFERAERTGDRSRIGEANALIGDELDAMDADSDGGALHHGGPLVLLTVYLRYRDRPDLLDPGTRDRIKTGRLANGRVDEAHSLVVYRDRMFDRYTVDDVNLDIEAFNPWQPRPSTAYNGTENHKLQILTAAMLLTEVYADETVRDHPVKDDTAATDDYWHYFRDAFFRYSGEWEDGYPTDHLGGDVNGEEKDAAQYTRAYIEDYWLLRDLHSDPIVRAHAEILLDRTLIDMAEDTVMGMYTGAAGRYYEPLPAEGINQHVHIIDHLLFASLGYELPLDHEYRWGFAAWGYANMLASDYNPTSPAFPRAIVDLAVDKEDGYLVRDGLERQANWVERDFALGFRVRGTVYGEGQSGGFFVYDRLARGAGLNVTMFHGATPFGKDRPQQTLDGVVARRVALVSDHNDHEDLQLWIKEGFATVQLTSTWLYFRQPSSAGREVYLAIRSSTGTNVAAPAITDPRQVGAVRTFGSGEDPLIWEVSTSDEHASFAAFQADVQDNALVVTDDRITYTSSALDVQVSYDRTGDGGHEVDGDPVDWTEFDHGFHTPWSSNAYGSHRARVDKGGYAVAYDWDPDDDGDVEELPTKVVDNDGAS